MIFVSVFVSVCVMILMCVCVCVCVCVMVRKVNRSVRAGNMVVSLCDGTLLVIF
jgi:hypothetical protein